MDLRLRILAYCWGEASSLLSLRANKHHPVKKKCSICFPWRAASAALVQDGGAQALSL